MINKLTKEQELKLSEYRNKWLKIGLDTKQITLDEAINIKNSVYKILLEKKDVPVILMDGPLSAYIATIYLASIFKLSTSQLMSQVRSQVESQVWSQVWSQVESQVWSQVMSQVWSQVRSQVRSQVWSQVESQIKDFFFPYLYGHFDSGVMSFYDYIFAELGINNPVKEKFDAYKLTTTCGCIYACDDFCVISQKPAKIMMKDGLLHCDGGTAWEYADGVKGYALNGVAVPEYLAITPDSNLDIDFFKKENNADVKAEFVRKYGVERMLGMGRKIDDHTKYNEEWWNKSEYELWDMHEIFPGLTYQPYLKMKNQTTGTWHVEAVSPECTTLPLAIKERLGGRELKITNIK